MAVKRIHLEGTASTNRYLSWLLKEGSFPGEVLITADYQDSGKGQGGHQWHSKWGENLLMSLLLFPAFLSASDQFQLSRVASLAIIDVLKGLGLAPLIKWPNDILINEKKVAGILIENGITGKNISHTIIGIGLNLNQKDFPVFPVVATSVALESGFQHNREEVTARLLEFLITRYRYLEEGRVSYLESEYLKQLFLLNQPARYATAGSEFTGIIRGISDLGELLLESYGITRTYAFQEIRYIPGGRRN